ncbi:hypothetical protein [Geobacter sp.]|uniref:hypothetical protein n=1 Tax=Geobacter sp. TaxID=46610 RepID=UPI0026020361|nr:hypothetical protein [Geobacter sp.]
MRIWLVICLLLLAGGVCGCSDHRQEEESALRQQVERYTRLLAEGYVKFDMSGLRDVITPNHEARLEHRLNGLKMAKRRMESKLRKLDYLGVTFETDKPAKQRMATVRTREVWDVRQVDPVSGKTEKEIQGLTYLLDYQFLQVDDRWLIEDVVVLEDTSP